MPVDWDDQEDDHLLSSVDWCVQSMLPEFCCVCKLLLYAQPRK